MTKNKLNKTKQCEQINTKLELSAIDEAIEIVSKIIKARVDLHMSQRDLACKCNMKQSALARIEQFKVIPKLTTIIKIAKCVNVSFECLNQTRIGE